MSGYTSLLPNKTNVESLLLSFTEIFVCNYNPNNFVSVGFVDVTKNYCNHIMDEFAQAVPHPKYLDLFINATQFFFFVRNFTHLLKFPKKWLTSKFVNVVVCEEVTSSKAEILQIFRAFWTEKILHFILVFVDSGLKIMSFDPFQRKIVNLNEGSCPKLIRNKMEDMYGYEVKVAMFENPPQIYKENGAWVGKDARLLELVIWALNATLKVVEMPMEWTDIAQKILVHEVDFSFMGLIQIGEMNAVDVLNPHINDAFVALIPKPRAHITTILRVFDWKLWVFLLCLCVLFLVLINFIKKFRKVWLLGCLGAYFITLNIFQSAMSGTMTRIQYSQEMKTVDELVKSELPMYVFGKPDKIYESLPGTEKKIHIVSRGVLFKMLVNAAPNQVFILPLYVALAFKDAGHNREFYTIMDEFIFPSFRIFLFQKYSPFLPEISRIVLLLKQAGLIPKVYEYRKLKEEKTQYDILLTMKHLESVFRLFLFGVIASCVCCIVEIIIKNCRKNKKL